VIALGDSFHDPGAGGRMARADRGCLAELTAGREWIWIAGNHDPVPPAAVGGQSASVVRLGPLVFRHEALPGAAEGEVSGHLHPKAMVKTAGRRIRARCFVTDGRRLILPAFGAYTGGLDIGDPAIAGLLTPPCTIYVLGHTRIHTLAWRPSPASGAAAPGGIKAGHDG
jgi:DNA ligase-associated metallophosphoesterase